MFLENISGSVLLRKIFFFKYLLRKALSYRIKLYIYKEVYKENQNRSGLKNSILKNKKIYLRHCLSHNKRCYFESVLNKAIILFLQNVKGWFSCLY